MRGRELRRVLKLRPFKPVRLHFLEGETFDIQHPELVWIMGQMLFIGSGRIEDDELVDGEFEAIYSIEHLKKVEYLEQPAPSDNGR